MEDIATLGIRIDSLEARIARGDLDKLTESGGRAEKATDGLKKGFGALKGVFAAVGVGALAKEYLDLVDEGAKLTAQLKLATSEFGNFGKAQSDVRKIAAETRSDLSATAGLYANFNREAKQLGITQDTVATVTKTVTQALKVSGSGADEASGAIRQLSQALASGALRGDEFNSVNEAAPRLMRLLADSMEIPKGQLRKMAEEGKLTAKVMTDAFGNKQLTEALQREFDQLPVTFGDAMTRIHNSAVIAFSAFDQGGEFSKMLTNFLIGGADDFDKLEERATNAGINIRAQFDGLAAVFQPVIDKTRELLGLFGQFQGVDIGRDISVSIGQLDSATSWLDPIGDMLGLRDPKFDAKAVYDKQVKISTLRGNDRKFNAWANANVGTVDKWRDDFEGIGKATTATNANTAATDKNNKKKSEAQKAAEAAAKASAALAKRLDEETKELERTTASLYDIAGAYARSTAEGIIAEAQAEAAGKGFTNAAKEQAFASALIRKAVAETVKEYAVSNNELGKQMAAQKLVNDQVEAGALSVDAMSEAYSSLVDQMKLKAAIDAAKKNGDIEGEKHATAALNDLTDATRAAANEESRRQSIVNAADYRSQTEEINREAAATKELGEARKTAMQNLSGEGLEDELANIEANFEKASIASEANAKITVLNAKAKSAATKELADSYIKEAEAIRDKALAEQGLVDRVKTIEDENVAYERQLNLINALNGAMSNSVAGKWIGALTSNNPTESLLGMGGLGTLVGLSTSKGQDAYEKQREAMRKGLVDVFGEKAANFAGTLSSALQGAGTGSVVGGILGGGKSSQIGSQMGGALGQVAGQEIGSKIGGALGKAAGPFGAVAGAVIGNIVGGLLKKTKKGTATFDETGLVSTGGNSDSRIATATKAGESILDSFNALLDELNATATGIKFSAGVRKDKFRLDPTGQGRTKGAGVLDFGKDEEKFLRAILQEMISDATFTGLSSGFTNFLKQGGADGIEERIGKIRTLQAAQSELKSLKDPKGFALDELEKSFGKLREIAKATGEGLADIEELYGIKRAKILEEYTIDHSKTIQEVYDQLAALQNPGAYDLSVLDKWRADMVEQFKAGGGDLVKLEELYQLQRADIVGNANASILQKQRAEAELTVRILELQGNATAALNLQRDLEVEGLPESTRLLYKRIYALEDEAKASEAATIALEEANAKAKVVADQRITLEERLFNLSATQGEIRERELQATDPLNASILQLIFDREDELAAIDRTQTALEQSNAKREKIETQYESLENRLLNLNGDKVKLRERELLATEPQNRTLLQLIFNREDELEAIDKASAALEDANNKRKAIADEAYGIETQWLQAIGDTATLRARELEKLDPSNRKAMQALWDYQDAQAAAAKATEQAAAAQQAYNEQLNTARNAVSAAYERERSELQATSQSMKAFSESIKTFKASVLATDIDPTMGIELARKTYNATSKMAQFGDEKALGNFVKDAQEYLKAVEASGTFEQLQKARAEVLGGSDKAIDGATGLMTQADKQLAANEKAVSGILDLNQKVKDLDETIAEYLIIQKQVVPDFREIVTSSMDNVATKIEELGKTQQNVEVKKELREEQIMFSLNDLVRLIRLVTDDGDAMRSTLTDKTVTLTNENINVTVTNTPLPTTSTP